MSYKFDTIVNRNEADALKEMIFRRARERAQSMTEDVQSDIMDLARDSFVSKDNPFSNIIKKDVEDSIVEPETVEKAEAEREIGFPIREHSARIASQNRLLSEQASSAVLVSNMQEAREGLSQKRGFMGALNFLNSQAAVSLIRTRADKFEVIV